MTCATNCVVPLTGKAVVDAVIVMVEPEGASNGTFWQPTVRPAAASTLNTKTRAPSPVERDLGISGNMKSLNILMPMKLRGQAQEGYAMAALLVAMSIMAVMMTVAMPVWKQSAQREKEEELVFRGKQYVHAIALFQRKYVGAATRSRGRRPGRGARSARRTTGPTARSLWRRTRRSTRPRRTRPG